MERCSNYIRGSFCGPNSVQDTCKCLQSAARALKFLCLFWSQTLLGEYGLDGGRGSNNPIIINKPLFSSWCCHAGSCREKIIHIEYRASSGCWEITQHFIQKGPGPATSMPEYSQDSVTDCHDRRPEQVQELRAARPSLPASFQNGGAHGRHVGRGAGELLDLLRAAIVTVSHRVLMRYGRGRCVGAAEGASYPVRDWLQYPVRDWLQYVRMTRV
ncbi:hypothetical protein XELAEV_18036977mg [Xenopus laevis]|uniref:Uncharacterized protein n=1 Tax=Xenopus laevis TaxID=8355 RepID=A0A974H9R9_XENLA|nr:hypothetical protein XELAEV_18036977mg [Xenopus laevis]